ncbi:ABC transporter ATP-binding protein [Sedimentitalea nanhaiensis]|uniref:Oligopeptide/dipeptide ABC transporter, ATP-binding protein, C-terminal domain-containing protein n=1 Tax=Sedimentitalea nanhaiensis TaxID=999627 RepID=A0A1I7BHE1_9RHOB|nr:oligopeptide/dipeptide ABC transporter ATP-binding protein [Sedimentitalea nanhaiensis]SFT86541.1 oligopeptide/dipeptide ABC transporter, ATP-binding protein, C-terminal domain-containing protein [Sedimentitalea nanhaiensis]
MSDLILEARNLVKHFRVNAGLFNPGDTVHAVDGVSLDIRRGETFAIVGESGCGKSTLARLMMRLLTPTSGEVKFDGTPISTTGGAELRRLRGDLQFIFQDPFSSLNPRLTVGKLIAEPLELHAPELDGAGRRDRVGALLSQVGLMPEHADRYPHEFSGGQRQRIGIARALASGPKLIIGDEPVSALDVSVQAQVINLLSDLGRDLDLTLVIIAHDLAVIRHMSDRVAVMYLGQIVETGPTDAVFDSARHPYTQLLLDSIPVAEHGSPSQVARSAGETPSPLHPPSGCRFHTRCPHARALCQAESPVLGDQAHGVACHFWREIAAAAPRAGAKSRTLAAQARFDLYRAAADGANISHKTNKEIHP